MRFYVLLVFLLSIFQGQDFSHYQADDIPVVAYKAPVCKLGQTIYASCVNHHVTVPLTAANSLDFTSVYWSVQHSGVSLSSSTSLTPLLKVNAGYPICYETVTVNLVVKGKNGESDSCDIQVVLSDHVKPSFTLDVVDLTVECDDIPSPAYVGAKDDCDKVVDIEFQETESAHDVHVSVIKRTWVAVDNCGNINKMSQIISILNSELPVLVGVDDDVTVPCDQIPKPCVVVAVDNCDDDNEVQLSEKKVDGSCENSYKLIRSWSTQDSGYNVGSQSQTITVQDEVLPELLGVPGNSDVNCNGVPELDDAAVTAEDNCGDVELKSSQVKRNEQCPHEYELVRTWTAIDDCGNQVTDESTLKVLPLVPEVYSGSDDITVQCGMTLPDCEPDYDDPCDYGVELIYTETPTPGTCKDEYTVLRTWTTTNVCGQTDSATQMVTVEDQEVPKFTTHPPKQRTVSCDNIPTYRVTAVDDCDDDVEVDFVPDNPNLTDYQVANYEIYRTWTAEDNCGNSISITQTINVVDSTPPMLIGVPPNVKVECDSVPEASKKTVKISDQCPCDHLNVSYIETRKNTSCIDQYTLIRTWSGADCSGNDVSRSQTIQVVDTTPPFLVAQEGVQALSIEDLAGNVYFDSAHADDNCADIEPQYADDRTVPGSCAHSYHIVKEVSAEDNCGNRVAKFHTITVHDKIPPVLAGIPYSQTWQCDDERLNDYAQDELLNGDVVTASDNSQNPDDPGLYSLQIYFEKEKIAGECDQEYLLHLSWTVIDDCANKAEHSMYVTIVDEVPPFITPTKSVTCDDCSIPDAEGLVSVTDNCAEVTLVFDEHRDYSGFPCPTEFNIYREWNSVDECGNIAQPVFQTVRVVDRSPPTWVVDAPEDVTAHCFQPQYILEPTARDDNCYERVLPVNVDYSEKKIFENCEYDFTLIRTWVATDCIGNFAHVSQTVTVIDVTPPIFTKRALNETVNCAHSDPPVITTTDNCEYEAAVSYYQSFDYECAKQYNLYRRWIATDLCGNTNEMHQTIRVLDNEAPVLVGPGDTVQNCDVELAQSDASCTDDCSYIDEQFSQVIIPGACPHNYMVIRTWSCEDECGKSVSHTQSVKVMDSDPPVFDTYLPASLTAECDNVPVPPTTLGGSDNCGYPLTGLMEKKKFSLYANFKGKYEIIRTWIIKDSCGNTAIFDQTLTVDDTVDPVFHDIPASLSVVCEDVHNFGSGEEFDIKGGNVKVGKSLNFGKPYATDNCAWPEISYYEDTDEGDCKNEYTLKRIWTAKDSCGNEATATQMVHVEDKQKPEFLRFIPSYHYSSPTVDVSNLNDEIQLPRAYDNCDSIPVVNCSVSKEPGCTDDDYTLTRICIAVDDCGNTGYPITQVVEVEDREPCPFDTFQDDIEIQCDDDVGASYVAPTHECAYMTMSESIVALTCEDNGLIIKTFTVSDECGNSKSKAHTTTILDTTAPTIPDPPEDINVSCAEPQGTYVIVKDNCDGSPEQLYKEKQIMYTGPHNFKTVQEWIVSDRCGNRKFYDRTVTVYDDTAPTMGTIPDDITVDHLTIPPYPDYVNCEDNCETSYMSQNFNEQKEDGSCELEYELYREWCCVDSVGNEICNVQTINVVDEIKPSFYGCPHDRTQLGMSAIEFPTLEAGDGYGQKAVVTKNSRQEYSTYLYSSIIVREWVATDDCQNQETCVQTIFITEPPPILCVPDNMTLDCTEAHLIPNISTSTNYIDECSGDGMNISLIYNKRINGSCPNDFCVHRKWSALDDLKGSITHGQEVFTSQTICVYDIHGPTWDFGAYRTVDCTKAQYLPEYLDIHPVEAEDDCGAVKVTSCCWKSTDAYGFTRDYTATDECGHSTTERMIVQVVDMEDPEFIGLENVTHVTVECSIIPAPVVTVKDNCGDPTLKEYQVVLEQSCAHRIKVLRGWRAVDEKGNEAIKEQTINVVDNDPPEWVGDRPHDRTFECDEELPAPPTLLAQDKCVGPVGVTYLGETHTSPAEISYATEILTVIRCWIVYDDCGQSRTHCQSILVYDTTHPELHGVPDDIIGECSAYIVGSVTATDNCGAPSMHSWNVTETGSCITEKHVVTYWEACDDVGHCVHDAQTLIVQDTQPPVFLGIYVDNVEVDCDQVPPAPSDARVRDECDQHITVDYKEVTIKSAYWIQSEMMAMFGFADDAVMVEYDLIRTWSATDTCGHHIQKEQSIWVNDRSPPVFPSPPQDVTVDCHDVASANIKPGSMVAKDNCDTSLYETFNEKTIEGTCPGDYKIVREWSARDNKDNIVTHVQTVTVVEEFGPHFTYVPTRKVYVECDEMAAYVVPTVTAEDECSEVTVTFNETEDPGTCGEERTLYRKWYADDVCGHQISYTQIVFVTDEEKPYCVKCPNPYQTLDCTQTVEDLDVEIRDDCGSVTVSDQSVVISNTCQDAYTRETILTASDECGNAITVRTTLSVVDTTPPTFSSLPSDESYECEFTGADQFNWFQNVSVADDCTAFPKVTRAVEHVPGSCEFASVAIYTWTVVDDCGNSAHASRTVSIYDHTSPTFDLVPPDDTLHCTDSVPIFNVIATDNCDGVFAYVQPVSNKVPLLCEDNYYIVYTWDATDQCGNQNHSDVTITWDDKIRPEFSYIPNPKNHPCDEIPEPPSVSASDDCDPAVIVHFESSGNGSYDVSSYHVDYLWWTVDRCGNRAEHTSYIDVFDTTPPEISAVFDITVPCKEEPEVPDVFCHDNCDPHVLLEFTETHGNGSCDAEYTITREWYCEDNEGLNVTSSYIITIVDTEAPVLEGYIPHDMTRECDQVYPAARVSATDVCDYSVDLQYDVEIGYDKCDNKTTHSWIATDNCGHVTSATWTLTIIDSTPPVLSQYPPDVTVPCSEVNLYDGVASYSVFPGEITASDNCHYAATVKFGLERKDGSCEDDYDMILSWSAVDDCGNVDDHSMRVSVYDKILPSFEILPPDMTIDAYAPYVSLRTALVEATATDDCDDDVEITGTEEKLARQYNRDCPNEFLIVRILTATDNCGNSVTHMYSINSIDTTPPTLPDIEDITVECDEYEGYSDCEVIPTSIGDEDLEVHLSSHTEQKDDHYVVYKEWTVTDCAYQSASTTQEIKVVDKTPPVFSRCPEDTTFDCGCLSDAPEIKAYDNCDTVTVIFDDTNVTDVDCSSDFDGILKIIHRVWSTVDTAGNEAVCRQNVMIVDVSVPILCNVDDFEDITVSCNEVAPTPEPVLSDECWPDDIIPERYENVDQTPTGIDGCENDYYYVDGWDYSDRCGNEHFVEFKVTVYDNEAPKLLDDDDLCLFPEYGADFGRWASYDVDFLFEGVDDCSPDDQIEVNVLSCNATGAGVTQKGDFLEECFEADMGNTVKIYIKIDRDNDPPDAVLGRTYHVYGTLVDPCGNAENVRRDIFIANDQYIYEHKQPCQTGDPKYHNYPPVYNSNDTS